MAKLKNRSSSLSLVSLITILAVALFIFWFNGTGDFKNSLGNGLNHFLLNELIRFIPPPPNAKVDVIYIMGGAQRSLEYKYKIAADLFHKGTCNRIWILSRPGKTEYNPSVGKNLTNDEWSLLKFNEFGVQKEYVEPIKMKEGFFGTFSEAKGISSLMEGKSYKSILLISVPYHTRRTIVSFRNFLNNHNIALYIQGSGENVFLRDLIVEFLKLKIYQYFLM